MTTSPPEPELLDQPVYNVRRQLLISRVVYGLLAFTAVADALTAQSRDQRAAAVSSLVCAGLGYMLARRSPAWRLVGIPCFIWARYGSPIWPVVVLGGVTLYLLRRDRHAPVVDANRSKARGLLVTAGVVTGALLYLPDRSTRQNASALGTSSRVSATESRRTAPVVGRLAARHRDSRTGRDRG